jgi:hypothetical protein
VSATNGVFLPLMKKGARLGRRPLQEKEEGARDLLIVRTRGAAVLRPYERKKQDERDPRRRRKTAPTSERTTNEEQKGAAKGSGFFFDQGFAVGGFVRGDDFVG